MCSGEAWTVSETYLAPRGTKRSLREIQERKVASVCLGIRHMMKRRRMVARATGAGTSAAATATPAPADGAAAHDHDHLAFCRLCESTRRVLSIARAHGEQRCLRRDEGNCEACRLWAMVRDRCASLGIIGVGGADGAIETPSSGGGGGDGDGGGDVDDVNSAPPVAMKARWVVYDE